MLGVEAILSFNSVNQSFSNKDKVSKFLALQFLPEYSKTESSCSISCSSFDFLEFPPFAPNPLDNVSEWAPLKTQKPLKNEGETSNRPVKFPISGYNPSSCAPYPYRAKNESRIRFFAPGKKPISEVKMVSTDPVVQEGAKAPSPFSYTGKGPSKRLLFRVSGVSSTKDRPSLQSLSWQDFCKWSTSDKSKTGFVKTPLNLQKRAGFLARPSALQQTEVGFVNQAAYSHSESAGAPSLAGGGHRTPFFTFSLLKPNSQGRRQELDSEVGHKEVVSLNNFQPSSQNKDVSTFSAQNAPYIVSLSAIGLGKDFGNWQDRIAEVNRLKGLSLPFLWQGTKQT